MRPVTTQHWQDAVDAAHMLTMLEHARVFGLLNDDSTVNVERCAEIIEDGKTRGIRPRAEAAAQLVINQAETLCGICASLCTPSCPIHK